MHTLGCTSAISHGEDDSGTATDDVATCEDGRDIGLHTIVDNDCILATQLEAVDAGGHDGIRRHANSYDSLV